MIKMEQRITNAEWVAKLRNIEHRIYDLMDNAPMAKSNMQPLMGVLFEVRKALAWYDGVEE
jgi:hypothetical protein